MGKVVRGTEAPPAAPIPPLDSLPPTEQILSLARYNKDHTTLTASEKKLITNWLTNLKPDSHDELLPLLYAMSTATTNDQLNQIAAKLAASPHEYLKDDNILQSGRTHRDRISQA